MKINVYSQEFTTEIVAIEKRVNDDLVYSGVAMMLHSSERLHYRPGDDDRSAVVFWLPRSAQRRSEMADAFERVAQTIRAAKPETGAE